MKAKNQRLMLAVMALIALLGAGVLAASALKEEASYFYTPATLAKARIAPDTAVRLGGMVKKGSIKRAADGVTVNFIVQDQTNEVGVTYRGITPDLFVEGSGVVADGRLGKGGVFVADHMLAKHDENYVPRELKDIDMTAAAKTQESIAQ
jgi:cytochrome c-type biogenesis protein CcmE